MSKPVEKKDYTVRVNQPMQPGKHLHYWYGGFVSEIFYKGYTFKLEANGDVRAALYADQGEELCYVKDRGNQGRFMDEMSYYIENDTQLLDLIEDDLLVFENNNWWECFVIDPDGQWHDLMWDLDSMNYFDAVEEIIAHMDEVIAHFEKNKEDVN